MHREAPLSAAPPAHVRHTAYRVWCIHTRTRTITSLFQRGTCACHGTSRSARPPHHNTHHSMRPRTPPHPCAHTQDPNSTGPRRRHLHALAQRAHLASFLGCSQRKDLGAHHHSRQHRRCKHNQCVHRLKHHQLCVRVLCARMCVTKGEEGRGEGTGGRGNEQAPR